MVLRLTPNRKRKNVHRDSKDIKMQGNFNRHFEPADNPSYSGNSITLKATLPAVTLDESDMTFDDSNSDLGQEGNLTFDYTDNDTAR